jgi:Ribbon-helix-helix protein, copG family
MKGARSKVKRKVGRPRTHHEFIGIRCLPDLVERINKWQARHARGKSRSEAIRALVEVGLKHEDKGS